MQRPSRHSDLCLGGTFQVQIDRPLGAVHPRHRHMIYPINYGFVPGTLAGDGIEIDAYVLGVSEPLATFTGVCRAIIKRHNDIEDKLVVCPAVYTPSMAEIARETAFQEQFFQTEVIMASD